MLFRSVTADERLNEEIARLVLAFGIDHIVIDKSRPTDPERSMYCSNTAITRGKPAMTVESGYLGSSDPESIERIVAGVLGVLRELKMLPDGPEPLAEAIYLDPAEVLTSPETGILYPQVERGAWVEKGQLLARITDFFGATIAEIHSPLEGVVLYIVATPPIVKGQPVGCVGAPLAARAGLPKHL